MNHYIELSFSNLLADQRKQIALGLVDTLANHYKIPSLVKRFWSAIDFEREKYEVEYVETPMTFKSRPRAKRHQPVVAKKKKRGKRKSDAEIFLSLFSSTAIRQIIIVASVVGAISLAWMAVLESKKNPSNLERSINKSFNNLQR